MAAIAPAGHRLQQFGMVAYPRPRLTHQLAVESPEVVGAAVAASPDGVVVLPERVELGLLPRLAPVGVLEEEVPAVLLLLESGPCNKLEQRPILVLEGSEEVGEVTVVNRVVVPAPLRTRETHDNHQRLERLDGVVPPPSTSDRAQVEAVDE
eukprot:9484878-Pyramimonas_sp.AAC.1